MPDSLIVFFQAHKSAMVATKSLLQTQAHVCLLNIHRFYLQLSWTNVGGNGFGVYIITVRNKSCFISLFSFSASLVLPRLCISCSLRPLVSLCFSVAPIVSLLTLEFVVRYKQFVGRSLSRYCLDLTLRST